MICSAGAQQFGTVVQGHCINWDGFGRTQYSIIHIQEVIEVGWKLRRLLNPVDQTTIRSPPPTAFLFVANARTQRSLVKRTSANTYPSPEFLENPATS